MPSYISHVTSKYFQYERLVLHLKQPNLGHNTSRSTWVLMGEKMLGYVDRHIRNILYIVIMHGFRLGWTFLHDGSTLADSIAECTRKKGNIFNHLYLIFFPCFARSHPSFVPCGICHYMWHAESSGAKLPCEGLSCVWCELQVSLYFSAFPLGGTHFCPWCCVLINDNACFFLSLRLFGNQLH